MTSYRPRLLTWSRASGRDRSSCVRSRKLAYSATPSRPCRSTPASSGPDDVRERQEHAPPAGQDAGQLLQEPAAPGRIELRPGLDAQQHLGRRAPLALPWTTTMETAVGRAVLP